MGSFGMPPNPDEERLSEQASESGTILDNQSRREAIETKRRRFLYLSCINQVALQAVLYERRVFGFGLPLDVNHQLKLIASYESRALIPELSTIAVDQLPFEILAHIFVYAVDGCVLSMKMRHILASVSRRWRAATLSCPAVWEDFGLASRITKQHIELDVERSSVAGNPNLIIDHWPDSLETVKSYAEVVALRKANWTSVHLRYTRNRQMKILFEEIRPNDFPSCRKLYVNGMGHWEASFEQLSRGVKNLLRSAPLLNDLTVENAHVHAQMIVPSLVRLNLLNLYIEPPVIKLLPGLVSLRYLSVSAYSFFELEDGKKPLFAPNSLELLSLNTLVIHSADRLRPINTVLQALESPRLRCLSVGYDSWLDGPSGSCHVLRAIIQEKNWDIHYLDIGYPPNATMEPKDSTWKAPLAIMPNLRCLAAQSSLILSLAYYGFSACTHLEEVVLYDPKNRETPMKRWTTRVVKAVRHMINAGVPLSRVRLLQTPDGANSSLGNRSGLFSFDAHYRIQKELAILDELVDVYTTWNDSPFLGCRRMNSPHWPTYDPKVTYNYGRTRRVASTEQVRRVRDSMN